MSDIATLGIKIDSTQVVASTTALDKFSRSATNAGKSAGSITTAGTLARHELINLSRQIQDVGVSLASGQSPFMVLAQQGTQIADIFGSSKTASVGGAFKQVASGVASILTPVRVLALGITGVAAAAGYAIISVANLGKQFDDTAKSAGTTLGFIRDLSLAAASKGIDGADFSKGMDKFGDSVYQAKNNMGGLAEVFRANNTQAKSFNDYLFKAADLIKDAKDDQTRLHLLQQMGLPATMEWVRFLSQGGEALRQATADAAKMDPQFAELVAKARAFDEAWNTGWANFKRSAQNATVSVAGWLDSLSNKGTALLMKLPGIGANVPGNILRNAFSDQADGIKTGSRLTSGSDVAGLYAGTGAGTGAGNGKGGGTVDPAVLQRQISLEQQRLGLLGQTTTAEEAALQVQLQAQQARLSGVSVDQKRIEVLKQLAREQTLGITAIKASTDAQRVEAATIGMSVGDAAAYAAAQNAINDARRAGRELTPGNIAAIQAEAQALGDAAARADTMKFSYESLVRGPLQTFVSSLQQGKSAMDSLRAAGTSALNAISAKLVDMAAQGLWKAAFGGTSGGIFASLFSGTSASVNHAGYGPGDSAPSRIVHPAYFDNAPRFHSGIGPGERAAIIRNDESVLTPGQMKQLSPKGHGVTIGDTILNITGSADDKTVQMLRRELGEHRKTLFEILKSNRNSAHFSQFGVGMA